MLDSETKRRIDTARDILVGKVPDPKSQVEQITIALIYKFMDDMDAESEELGGQRHFFTGDFARYGWAKLMRSGLGGHETLNLYAEAIARMPENPGIPLLFRDIFKNAFLPYRDPETLRAFLKIIDEFTYDHSERLGDAFEYLLSVLGSQGDAGQFRTPRHIIDFIVSVVAPEKDETILDPACGTAGFLISAWKHIVKSNTNADGVCTLTPDERTRLALGIHGYDISPDMVRLSLVNLYLHGFTDPHIVEYDTLTSQERWNETADVILANPPFMSPKGGIKPHNRFSVQSKRSEVLFVDYMAEHLNTDGRAGIIVPEGIIFQSQTAYKDLRKMLVKEYLVAVVSLPAGVFNPYSGVKTSILILDKALVRQSSTIGFFKVENDGYGLGAQRREINKNDLPQVGEEIRVYLETLRSHRPTNELNLNYGLVVPKEKICENGDCNLNGDKYRVELVSKTVWAPKSLSDVCTKITDGSHNPPERAPAGKLMLSSQNVFNNRLDLTNFRTVSEEDFVRENARTMVTAGDVLLTIVGTIGRCLVVTEEMPPFMLQRSVAVLGPNPLLLEPHYLARVLQSPRIQTTLQGLANGVAQKGVYLNDLRKLEVPIPPLDVQKEIVTEIEGYQKVIDGACAVLDNYRPHIPIHPDWPTVQLREVIQEKPKNGYSGSPVDYETGLKVLSLSATTTGKMDLSKFKYLDEQIPADAPCRCQRGDIYLQRGNTKELVGTAALLDVDAEGYIYPDLMIRIRADETKILSHYLLTVLQSALVRDFITRNAVGAAGSMPKINQSIVESIPIPLPALSVQSSVVNDIHAEQSLVSGNLELIARFEKKINGTIARIWGEKTAEQEA